MLHENDIGIIIIGMCFMAPCAGRAAAPARQLVYARPARDLACIEAHAAAATGGWVEHAPTVSRTLGEATGLRL